jgi:hypothetical protein
VHRSRCSFLPRRGVPVPVPYQLNFITFTFKLPRLEPNITKTLNKVLAQRTRILAYRVPGRYIL